MSGVTTTSTRDMSLLKSILEQPGTHGQTQYTGDTAHLSLPSRPSTSRGHHEDDVTVDNTGVLGTGANDTKNRKTKDFYDDDESSGK